MYIRLKYFRQNVKFSFGFEELKEFHSQKLILQIPTYVSFSFFESDSNCEEGKSSGGTTYDLVSAEITFFIF